MGTQTCPYLPELRVSDAERKKAIGKLEEDVEQFITDGLQDWQAAAYGAIDDAQEPQEGDDSGIAWFIGLMGNMLWAATVFFPPAAAVAGAAAGASRATKIASLLGATVGSGTYTQLKAHPPTKPLAKKFLRDLITQRRDQLKTLFLAAGSAWTRDEFLPYLLSLQPLDFTPMTSDDVVKPSLQARTERRNYTWDHLLFPDPELRAANGSTGLRKFMLKELQAALDDFNQQYDFWANVDLTWCPNTLEFTPHCVRGPFNPKLKFPGVPKQYIGSLDQEKIKKGSQVVDLGLLDWRDKKFWRAIGVLPSNPVVNSKAGTGRAR